MKADYLSYGEIHGQYHSLASTAEYIESRRGDIASFLAGSSDIVFLACGSSYWMSMSARATTQLRTGRNAFAVKAGDVLLCGEEYAGVYANPVFICPSRSGKTSEVLKAAEIMRDLYPESKFLAITAYEGTPLECISALTLRIPWAAEESVCQTRTFSNLYLASILIAEVVSGGTALFQDIRRYLAIAPKLYLPHEEMMASIAASALDSFVCLGCGLQYGVCIEGAYIVIEMAELNANYYQLL